LAQRPEQPLPTSVYPLFFLFSQESPSPPTAKGLTPRSSTPVPVLFWVLFLNKRAHHNRTIPFFLKRAYSWSRCSPFGVHGSNHFLDFPPRVSRGPFPDPGFLPSRCPFTFSLFKFLFPLILPRPLPARVSVWGRCFLPRPRTLPSYLPPLSSVPAPHYFDPRHCPSVRFFSVTPITRISGGTPPRSPILFFTPCSNPFGSPLLTLFGVSYLSRVAFSIVFLSCTLWIFGFLSFCFASRYRRALYRLSSSPRIFLSLVFPVVVFLTSHWYGLLTFP